MRVLATLLVALVVPAGGWSLGALTTAGTVLPAAPKCSAADTRRGAMLVVNGGVQHSPLYSRYCGPAHGVVDLTDHGGKSYALRGGFCRRAFRRGGAELVEIGLTTNPPSAPGRGFSLRLPPRAGRTRISDSEFEVPGRRVAAVGTVIVGTGLKGGTFTLHSRDATVHLAGSWACG